MFWVILLILPMPGRGDMYMIGDTLFVNSHSDFNRDQCRSGLTATLRLGCYVNDEGFAHHHELVVLRDGDVRVKHTVWENGCPSNSTTSPLRSEYIGPCTAKANFLGTIKYQRTLLDRYVAICVNGNRCTTDTSCHCLRQRILQPVYYDIIPSFT